MKLDMASERGAALIAALLLVALMAAVAVQLIDTMRFAAFRTAQIDQRAQAYWMARGARDLAEAAFLAAAEPARPVMRPDEAWLNGPVVFPLADGSVSGHVKDGNNCLNLNAFAGVEEGDGPRVEDVQRTQAQWVEAAFLSLADHLGAPPGQAEALHAQIVDWIDRDGQPEPGGAEDRIYSAFTPPYRAANQNFVEVQELRALPGMTVELYQMFAPYLCVRPNTQQQALNLNTLTLDQAVLLSAVFDGALSLNDAEALLFRRPPGGYDALDQVWAEPLLSRLEFDEDTKRRLTLRSRWLEMEISVRLADTGFQLHQLTELSERGDLRRHTQRFGAF